MMNTKRCYIDSRGWKYRVMPGRFRADKQKAHCYDPGFMKMPGWYDVKSLPWRDNIEEAQRDLDEYAKKHHMTEVEIHD